MISSRRVLNSSAEKHWLFCLARLLSNISYKNRAKLNSLCFRPEEFSIRRSKTTPVHLIQTTNLYGNPTICITCMKNRDLVGIPMVLLEYY